jgi:hypothetical protein
VLRALSKSAHAVVCFGLIAGSLAIAACGKGGGPSLSAPGQVDFGDAFRLVDTLRLAQSEDNEIIRISGMDVRSDGSVVLTDPSEGVVRLYGPEGKLLRTIGRRGSGPGEFLFPATPTFDAQGRIHVFDLNLMRVSVFNDGGALLRSVSLAQQFVSMQGGLALPDGGYALLANRPGTADILFEIDSAGRILHTLLPLAGARPSGRRSSPLWEHVRWNTVMRRGNELFVVSSVLDSVWTVRLPDNTVQGAHIPVSPYLAPSLPWFNPHTLSGVRKWGASQMLAMALFATDSAILIPFVTGTYNDGAPAVLAYRRPDGRWQTLRNAPPIVGVAGSRLIGILTPGKVPAHFAVFERKQ